MDRFILIHNDSKAGTDKGKFFYSAGVKGIWGLVDNSTARLDVGMTEDDAGFREGKAVLEVSFTSRKKC